MFPGLPGGQTGTSGEVGSLGVQALLPSNVAEGRSFRTQTRGGGADLQASPRPNGSRFLQFCTFLFHFIANYPGKCVKLVTCDCVVRCAGDAPPLSYTPVV